MNAPVEKTWTIPNRLELLPAVSRDVHDWLETHKLSSRAKYVGRLAVEEVAGNAIKYGFPGGGDHEIRVRIAVGRDYLRLDFTDDGIPFDPTQYPSPDLTVPVAQRKIGGLGIYYMHIKSDSMTYCRKDGKNILTIGMNGQRNRID